MKTGSMIDVAYDILNSKKEPVKFADLWAEVKNELEITPEEEGDRIGHFYSDLSLDARFHALTDNAWDLRCRYTFEECEVETGAFYSEIEESDNDIVDKQENDEYDASVRGSIVNQEETEEAESEESDSDEAKPSEGGENLGL